MLAFPHRDRPNRGGNMTAEQNSTDYRKAFLPVAVVLVALLAVSVLYAMNVSSDLKETKAALAAREDTIKLLEADLAATQSKLHEVQQQFSAQLAKKPDIPIRLGLRASSLGKGKVVLFKNMLNKPVSIAATFKNSNLNLEKSLRLDFRPDEEKQVGHLEGWQFESGDEITLVNQLFETKRVKVP